MAPNRRGSHVPKIDVLVQHRAVQAIQVLQRFTQFQRGLWTEALEGSQPPHGLINRIDRRQPWDQECDRHAHKNDHRPLQDSGQEIFLE